MAYKLFNDRRLPAATARCNSSDEDSTDSGEELDSPVKIVQQTTEGMDVDNAESRFCYVLFFFFLQNFVLFFSIGKDNFLV